MEISLPFKRLIASCAAALAIGLTVPAFALDATHFPAQSLLSSGRWMKVAVEESGVYEITYDELRNMGFSDPESVGLYGYDGYQLTENFTDAAGNALIPGEAQQIPVLHHDGKLLFYARGVEKIVQTKTLGNFPAPKVFDREGRNIYSRYVWYLVTDNASKAIEKYEAQTGDSIPRPLTTGIDYLYHENPEYHCYYDEGSIHGANTGRYYYGEKMQDRVSSFPIRLYRMAGDQYVQIKGGIFFEPYDADPGESKDQFHHWLGSGSRMIIAADNNTMVKPSTFTYTTKINSYSSDYVFSKQNGFSGRYSHLGHLVISYVRNISNIFDDFDQSHFLFTQVPDKGFGYIDLKKKGIIGFDITDPANPLLLEPKGDTYRITIGNTSDSYPEVVLFDTSKRHKRISGSAPVSVSDLRSRAAAGAEMLLVCVPALKDQAQRLAEIHAKTDGVKVMVATTTEIYDEFSAGTPDPMAIRSLVKMMSGNSATKLKNVLLFGPYRANARRIGIEESDDSNITIPADSDNPLPEFNCIIAWQAPGNYDAEYGADSYAEFYGNTADIFPDNYYNAETEIGVGVLPCNTAEEANMMVDRSSDTFLTIIWLIASTALSLSAVPATRRYTATAR